MPTTQPAGEPGQSATVPSADGQADRLAGQPHADLGSPPAPAMAGVSQLAKLVAAVVAPTTLLTSLLFFFGWSRAYWFYDYFGVHSTLLGLTTQDYVQQSLDGLFVPLTMAACAVLVALWAHTVLRSRLAGGASPRLLRVLLAALVGGGLALTVAGLWSVVATTVLSRHLAAAPISLAVGVVLLVYAAHLWRSIGARGAGAAPPRAAWLAIAEWAGVFVLVGLSLFWAANDYSAAVGRSRARQFVAELPIYPSAVIYSERSLNLRAPGVREVRCQDQEAAYRFRYDGLKLVLQSGDQYLFLPEAWTPRDGVAILMPRSDTLRLEFIPASAPRTTRAATC
jgi:hypothetical protein